MPVWRPWGPGALAGGWRAGALGSVGACLGLWATEWLSRHALGGQHPWFIAPMGASAVLLFMVPASPLAQPWAVLGGNVVSAVVGVTLAQQLGDSGAVAALAGALAIAVMHGLRCLHPPGGAVALMAVLGGPAVHQMGLTFVVWPVALNALLMLGLAWSFNRAVGRRYPHHTPAGRPPHDTRDRLPSQRLGVQSDDIDRALASFGEVLDIDRDDLAEILTRAQTLALRRQWGELRCAQIMSRDVVSVPADAPVEAAWARLAHHKVKALPVTDAQQRLVGIVSLHDFFIGPDGLTPARVSPSRPVREIMSARVITARPEQPLADLVPLLSDGGLHHLPVVDAAQRVVGMLTQSDLVAALFRSMPP